MDVLYAFIVDEDDFLSYAEEKYKECGLDNPNLTETRLSNKKYKYEFDKYIMATPNNDGTYRICFTCNAIDDCDNSNKAWCYFPKFSFEEQELSEEKVGRVCVYAADTVNEIPDGYNVGGVIGVLHNGDNTDKLKENIDYYITEQNKIIFPKCKHSYDPDVYVVKYV